MFPLTQSSQSTRKWRRNNPDMELGGKREDELYTRAAFFENKKAQPNI
jgi:hypothetical protein